MEGRRGGEGEARELVEKKVMWRRARRWRRRDGGGRGSRLEVLWSKIGWMVDGRKKRRNHDQKNQAIIEDAGKVQGG